MITNLDDVMNRSVNPKIRLSDGSIANFNIITYMANCELRTQIEFKEILLYTQ